MIKLYCVLTVILICGIVVIADETDYNVINDDGSYSYGLTNNDIGGHYHNAVGSASQVERGRFGSRNPTNGRVEETVYTAGPRGFRARGPTIHRKMDLSQIPKGPIGAIDDPLADPYDQPAYGFGFRTANYQRREDADALGQVNGLYSYLDDVGERHSVRYAAGANTGYEVSNAVPDTPSLVRYSAPLYKTSPNVRGRIAYERGPGGQYKFIASGPDQRRSESTGADGITRGSYSYLDDKGVQRTVQYIAGAGIGYRVVQSTTGIGTHLAPRPAIPEFGISSQSNDITDDDGSGFKVAESGGILSAGRKPQSNVNRGSFGNTTSGSFGSNYGHSGANDFNNFGPTRGSGTSNNYGGNSNAPGNKRRKSNNPNRGANRFNTGNVNPSLLPPNAQGSQGSSPNNVHSNNNRDNGGDNHGPPYVSNEYDDDNDDDDHDRKNNNWKNRGRDSETVVKNVGNWFVGLPPGAAVRAHVQSIDLLPLDGRPPSPGDALRHDEQRALSNS